MIAVTKLCDNENKYLNEMDAYIVKLKMMESNSSKNAYIEAKEALIRTGVITPSGKIKEKIVSLE